MRKATKTIISFAVVLIAGLNYIVPAFAQDPFTAIAVGGLTGASGAGLFGSMAGMSGIDIAWAGATSDPMDAMWNVLNPDHVYFSGEKHEADRQDPDDLYDYIQVDIGDWLQAQQDFISEFCTNYNVSDNDSGTVTTPKNYRGYPYESLVGETSVNSTQLGSYFAGTPDLGVMLEVTASGRGKYHFYNNGSQYLVSSTLNLPAGTWTLQCFLRQGTPTLTARKLGSAYDETQGVISGSSYTQESSVNWESGTVNLSVFDGWESAKVKIPKSISQLQTGWTPVDFFNELDRIWSGAGEDNIIIEDGGDTPVPPVPIPDTPLGNVPFDDWVDLWGQGIYQQLENQSDALDFIGSAGEDAIEELESIDENIGALEETAESIDTNIGIGNGLLGGIKSLAESAVDYLEGIAEHVGELVEEIVEGTETLIAGILNQIPQVFSVIFGPIKQASSIWHYVVEWITSIGAPFQFIWSMASGTSYYIILPVYASLAAAVVLAFYKRFGK